MVRVRVNIKVMVMVKVKVMVKVMVGVRTKVMVTVMGRVGWVTCLYWGEI